MVKRYFSITASFTDIKIFALVLFQFKVYPLKKSLHIIIYFLMYINTMTRSLYLFYCNALKVSLV